MIMSDYRASALHEPPLDPKDQPLVSVITPVYNGEEFLHECIESVLAQTYVNWDYTIVDNCSKDRTLEIARAYAAKDPRIRVLENTEFLPIIQNHNRAIRQISPHSKYCKVVQADDWLFPDCLMRMIALAESNPSIGLVGAYGLDGVRVIWVGLPYPIRVLPGMEACRRRLLGGPWVFGTPTSTLIRADFVRKWKSFYDEANLHADTTACFRVLQESDFGFINQILTFSRTRAESNNVFATRMNSFPLAWLTDLIEYGPRCLSDTEYRDRLQAQLDEYYEFLAESALQLRERKFWDFHKDRLRSLGIPLQRLRLFKAVCIAILKRLSHPILAARSVGHWWLRSGEASKSR
jgi:glycosyltransferase involved in cell wall biosynthesis